MHPRTLNAWTVAALLVSASYGIGFLFGSGELAITYGMAGSIYAVMTAIGMIGLAVFAPFFWRLGAPLWEMFNSFHTSTRNLVAFISAFWMLGILAAQIHGGASILQVLGMGHTFAYVLVCLLIFLVCRLDLKKLGLLFSLLLIAGSTVLFYVMAKLDGWTLYLQSIPRFVSDLPSFPATHGWVIGITTILLVITGADYQQFVVKAGSVRSATLGCLLAAGVLAIVGFLPACVALAAQQAHVLPHDLDGKQVIPFLMTWAGGGSAALIGKLFLLTLFASALGAGSAITLAIVSALTAMTSGTATSRQQQGMACVILALGFLLTRVGSTMIDLIVSFNVVYLSTILIPIALCILKTKPSTIQLNRIMLSGLLASAAVVTWGKFFPSEVPLESMALLVGMSVAFTAVFWPIKSEHSIEGG